MPVRKRFGQHFLHDPGVISRILDAVGPAPGERIVEVGPGRGALTWGLLARAARLDAIEIDRDLAAALLRDPRAQRGLRVLVENALDTDFVSLRGDGPALRIVHMDLGRHFNLAAPRICVLGLNPHAGESGHLGREEIDIIEPALAQLRAEGLDVSGPVPADTAFAPQFLANADVVVAMYHDQGLPVLKHAGFGNAVNITLGLPILRTSVDHGTALKLARTGRADAGSLRAALTLAIALAADGHAGS